MAATLTPNIGLKKPAYEDSADVAVLNENFDILDNKMGAIGNTSVAAQFTAQSQRAEKNEGAIAIVSDNNTHAAIAAGQFVYVKNHGSLAEGLYTANSALAANATLSSSNVTAVSGGGLNALNSKLDGQRIIVKSITAAFNDSTTSNNLTLSDYVPDKTKVNGIIAMNTTPGIIFVNAAIRTDGSEDTLKFMINISASMSLSLKVIFFVTA